VNELPENFRYSVERLMVQVPYGSVTTYGDVAALVGSPNAARIVGGIAHYGSSGLPWHRLVNRFGGLASAFPGGREVQQQLLEAEGLSCTHLTVDNFEEHRWRSNL
jgi:methylated-DNA-protein-cysteine methyltransferase-like protein